jgi:Mrp family chromosome partitioning ATPase
MTSLDQAFIKAYTHAGHDPAAAHPHLPQANAECQELDLQGMTGAGLPAPRSKRKVEKSSRTVPLAVALHYDTQITADSPVASASEVLEAFGRAPTRPADATVTTLSARISIDSPAAKAVSAEQTVRGGPWVETATAPAQRISRESTTGANAGVSDLPSGGVEAITDVPRPEPSPVPAAAEPQPSIPSLLAGYQVDHFIWPEICERLAAIADNPLEHLAEDLAGTSAGEGTVVAVVGCRRGEGATTLTLATARKMARGRRRTILVDADLDDAQLARQLGIQPESGLEDVLSGRMSLAEVIVESVEDSLALLPLRCPLAATESALKYLVQDLKSLRGHYDLILVKLGPLGDGNPTGSFVARSLASQIDTAVVVRSLRGTDAQLCDAVCDGLFDSGIAQVVVAENFAPAS